jgi:hypothetical protein
MEMKFLVTTGQEKECHIWVGETRPYGCQVEERRPLVLMTKEEVKPGVIELQTL